MPGLGRALPDTYNGEKEKCEAGGGGRYHAKTFEQSCALL